MIYGFNYVMTSRNDVLMELNGKLSLQRTIAVQWSQISINTDSVVTDQWHIHKSQLLVDYCPNISMLILEILVWSSKLVSKLDHGKQNRNLGTIAWWSSLFVNRGCCVEGNDLSLEMFFLHHTSLEQSGFCAFYGENCERISLSHALSTAGWCHDVCVSLRSIAVFVSCQPNGNLNCSISMTLMFY